MTVEADGLTQTRLREALESIETVLILADHWAERAETDEHRWNLESVCHHLERMKAALALPKTQAEKQVEALLLFFRKAQKPISEGYLQALADNCREAGVK